MLIIFFFIFVKVYYKDLCLRIRILTFNRPFYLSNLLNSLRITNFLNNRVDIEFFIDYEKSALNLETQKIVEDFKWIYGHKFIRKNKKRKGHSMQWMVPFKDNCSHLILEDDMIVDKNFFIYLRNIYKEYINSKIQNIYGIALHYQHLNMQNVRFHHYDVQKYLKLKFNYTNIYMHSQVSTWGPVFFSKPWNELVTLYKYYVKRKIQTCIPFSVMYDWRLRLDNWERVMNFLVYAKSLFMIYLNINEDLVLNKKGKWDKIEVTSTHLLYAPERFKKVLPIVNLVRI